MISDRVKKPWAIGAPNGPSFARSTSVWIHWWSLVASANVLIMSWVTVIHSVTPRSVPARPATSSNGTTVRAVVSVMGLKFLILNKQVLLDECAEAGNRPTNDQRVNFVGAFVGVHGFGVSVEACDVGVQCDAAATAYFTCQGNGFSQFFGGKHLGERRVLVFVGAGFLLFGQLHCHGHRGGDIGQHGGKFFLDQLEPGDGFAELLALGRVSDGCFIGAGHCSSRDPGCIRTHQPQASGNVLE